MRLHRLRLSAIGPFRDATELDLATFGNTGLFLIEGPTGSGKSTILDAISFALYGKPAQSQASIERLKSHHVPIGTEPAVELVFETQRGRYRIRRTAPYERPKKRGTGTLPVRMQVWLYRLTDPDDLDGGELISNNLGDAEDEITRAVGLSHGQFVQTVLLPQGEFANFLTAKTETKRDLLQKLFGTEVVQRTQLALIEGRQQAERERKRSVEAVRGAINAFAGATDLDEERVAEVIEAAERGVAEPLIELIAAEEHRLLETVIAARSALQDAERDRGEAEAQWQVATELQQRRELRSRLRTQLQLLLGDAANQQAVEDELAAAERALLVTSAADGLRMALAELQRGQAAETAARAELAARLAGRRAAEREPEAADLAAADDRSLRRAASVAATLLGRLDADLAREQALADHRKRQQQWQTELDEQRCLVGQADRALAELPARRQQLREQLAEAERAAARRPVLAAERDRAYLRLQAARKAEVAAVEAAQEKLIAQELFDSEVRAEQRLTLLRQQWRASIASQLGLALQAGDPCAVCGSVEHPKPARPGADAVSQQQLEQAERDFTALRQQVETRRVQLGELQAELVQLQLAAEQLPADKAQLTLDEVSSELDELSALADEVPGLQEELHELDAGAQQLERLAAEARSIAARREQDLAHVMAQIERDEQSVQQARAGYDSVAERLAALSSELVAVEAAADAAERSRAALVTATAAGEVLQQALDQAGFDGEAAWQASVRTPEQVERLRGQVRTYREQVTAIRSRLAEADLADPVLDSEPADLAALASAFERANAAMQLAVEQHGVAVDRAAAAQRLAERVQAALQDSAAVLSRTAPAVRLGNLVAGLGDNRLKMEFTTFVLVRRFAEVLAAANMQLHRISQGRYQLEHTDARTGSAKSGLNVRVLDSHTGRPRDPATLSGGETFYVSLALALGLADVVRAESGGIELGTLFIDEGFGTLDADVLDDVIQVLDGLRDGGRAVGIVSHVSELKLRIADRIKVIRAVDGTSRLLATV
ncbi:MAG TPA: AAA family ATPase [Jatrophihabitans sp.]|nr:AAA family ATPase [Jatrophihabitans sp.]